MWNIAFAQTAQASSGPSTFVSLLPLILIFLVFYFLLIRPQQKKAKDHREMLDALKKNDEVLTSGGIYGKVITLKDTDVTLEIAPNVRVRVNRPQISQVFREEKSSGKEVKAK
ncbi:MAG: preprotein translocase subunit YajC [Candidatus Binatia bacterium]|jgi:preprotein translocase subunit YajC|nr:preprotein translocase subunit YajC [Candidatus Binatia bacterium]|tara:strand:- start:85 stop:423 length:339 start_codon:yes stop_codon:yes gene_type:complete